MSLRGRIKYVATTGLRRRTRDLFVRPDQDPFVLREDLARRFIAGDGLEIGAASWPMRVPKGSTVRYVDYLPRDQLLAQYQESFAASGVNFDSVPPVDIVDDAGTLATVPDASVDFVVANHVLEHLQDPVRALQNLCRVVRPGGVVFITLPDPRSSFDNRRERTTVAHVVRDHEEGPDVSRRQHYEEWATFIDGAGTHAERMDRYEREDARHHFHVWELEDFLELLRALDLPASLEAGQVNGPTEFSVVLRKQRQPGGPPRQAAG